MEALKRPSLLPPGAPLLPVFSFVLLPQRSAQRQRPNQLLNRRRLPSNHPRQPSNRRRLLPNRRRLPSAYDSEYDSAYGPPLLFFFLVGFESGSALSLCLSGHLLSPQIAALLQVFQRHFLTNREDGFVEAWVARFRQLRLEEHVGLRRLSTPPDVPPPMEYQQQLNWSPGPKPLGITKDHTRVTQAAVGTVLQFLKLVQAALVASPPTPEDSQRLPEGRERQLTEFAISAFKSKGDAKGKAPKTRTVRRPKAKPDFFSPRNDL